MESDFMINEGEFVLLVSEDKRFLIKKENRKFNTEFGEIDLSKIKKHGQKLKSKKGKEFKVVKPSYIDLLRKARRMPQVILPKDASIIASHTGLSSGWKCLDAGTGSAFLASFIGNLVKPDGSVVSYERKKDFAKSAKKNIELLGLDKIVKIKNKSAFDFTEKNLDLVTLDMKDVENIIEKVYQRLNLGGWVVVYSPHIEQVKKTKQEMTKSGFKDIETIEVIKRKWKVDDYTHPVPSGIMHTGFMTFARKL